MWRAEGSVGLETGTGSALIAPLSKLLLPAYAFWVGGMLDVNPLTSPT